jgi:uncharacterized Zn-finger protein
MTCNCQATDARVCWAIQHPHVYLEIMNNPRCPCACHDGGEKE